MTSITLPVLSSETSLSRYLQEINTFAYLSKEEEQKLAKQWIDNQDVAAAHKLVTSHLRLVAKIAMGFRGYGLPLLELISEGNIGLMHAVKKFDPSKGFRLSTYAIWWIKASMQEYILKSWSLVKIGTTGAQKKLFFNLRKLKSRLKRVDDSALSPNEVAAIANELNVSEQDVIDMDGRIGYGDQSLNDPIRGFEGEQVEYIDYLADDSEHHDDILAEQQELNHKRSLFAGAMKTLNDRERAIVKARRLEEKPATLDDLSKVYNISRERVRQIEAKALEKLQKVVLAEAASR